jgi:periplasmic divalent cation tolerance protein
MTDLCEVIITAPDGDWLAAFVRQLVNDGLAACGHLTPIRSIYTWKNHIEDATETRVALHTRASCVPEITRRTNAEHPYDVPCVLATPAVDGDQAYRQWIIDNTDNR